MHESHEEELRRLSGRYWSNLDPQGRGFVPLAEAYWSMGMLDEAASLLEEGLERLPYFSAGHLVAARVARDRGELDVARWHIHQLLAIDPQNTLALAARAAFRLDECDVAGALRDLNRILELEPSNARIRRLILDIEGGGGEEGYEGTDVPPPPPPGEPIEEVGERAGEPPAAFTKSDGTHGLPPGPQPRGQQAPVHESPRGKLERSRDLELDGFPLPVWSE